MCGHILNTALSEFLNTDNMQPTPTDNDDYLPPDFLDFEERFMAIWLFTNIKLYKDQRHL